MANVARTLDIEEKQVLARYDEDDYFTWHHRVLLKRLEGSKWLVLTPDLGVEVCDLSVRPMVPLRRAAPFPAAQAADAYIFDPITPVELDEAKREARRLAGILADDQEDVEEAIWLVAQPGHENFGKEVPVADVENEQLFQSLHHRGIWKTTAGEHLFVERVSKAGSEEWVKNNAGGGDLRLLGTFRDTGGRRNVDFRQGVDLCLENDFKDFSP
jgi:hypothetical protein